MILPFLGCSFDFTDWVDYHGEAVSNRWLPMSEIGKTPLRVVWYESAELAFGN